VRRIASIVIGCLCVLPLAARAQQEDVHPRNTAPLTILQINDVYSTVPVEGAGGLARVATLKRRLAEAGRRPFLVLAGDFLSSSVASTIFKGEQMIAALNAAELDLATLGNHEFDFGTEILLQRMKEARWQWVVSNVVDRETGLPVGGAAPYVVRTFGPLKVGFLGLCLTSEGMPLDRMVRFELIDPVEAAAKYLPMLKSQQVDVIVALTHLTYAEDRALAERFPEIDLIVGGHEHFPIAVTTGRTFISKAGSEARYVARIDVNRRTSGLERFYELMPITDAIKDEPATAAVVQSWEAKLDRELDKPIATTRVSLDAIGTRIRTSETNLGNLVADAIRADANAEIAIVNSGGIRGERPYPVGALSRRTLLQIHPFGNTVCKIAVTGRFLLEVLNRGVSRLPTPAGQFLQVSGMTFTVDETAPAGSRIRDVVVNGAPLDPDKTYTLALPDFVLRGGDGYVMFAGTPALIGPDAGDPIVSALERYVTSRGEVAPAIEGRITVRR
jgi:2',3'-cyclic-nucleotide 2'-phosphodiesterase (5'-nucleotidase family)